MPNKYKKEMSKITVSKELKQKTLSEIKNRQLRDNEEAKVLIETKNNRYKGKSSKTNPYWFKIVPSVAISLILIIASVFINHNINTPNQPNVDPFDKDNITGSIMRTVGKIRQLSSDEKGNYIIVTAYGNDTKFYYDETTSFYCQGKPSDETMLMIGDNVEILYVGVSSQSLKEYKARKITCNYSEKVEVTDTRVQYSYLDAAKEALNREVIIPKVVPEGYKIDYIEIISNEILEIGYYNNADFTIFTETIGRVYIGNIIPNYDYTDTIDKNNVSYKIKGYENKIAHVEWSNNEHYFSILFQEGVAKEQMFEMIESLSEY